MKTSSIYLYVRQRLHIQLHSRKKWRIPSFVNNWEGNIADRTLKVTCWHSETEYMKEWQNRTDFDVLSILLHIQRMAEYSLSSKVEAAINKQLATEEEWKAYLLIEVLNIGFAIRVVMTVLQQRMWWILELVSFSTKCSIGGNSVKWTDALVQERKYYSCSSIYYLGKWESCSRCRS